jgi:hypothetical protein
MIEEETAVGIVDEIQPSLANPSSLVHFHFYKKRLLEVV